MTKAGDQLIAAAQEALSFAKGEQPPASIHVNGHTYIHDGNVLAAINIVKQHLDTEWISERCLDVQSFGCASCRAVALRQELTLLADHIIEDEASLPSPTTGAHDGLEHRHGCSAEGRDMDPAQRQK